MVSHISTITKFSYLQQDTNAVADPQYFLSVQFLSFSCSFLQKFDQTRMHSSRMRTARSSSRLGGGSPPGTPLRSRPSPGSRSPCDQAPPGTRHPPHRPDTPPVNRITDTCKNITFKQLRLRAVIIGNPGCSTAMLDIFHRINAKNVDFCYMHIDTQNGGTLPIDNSAQRSGVKERHWSANYFIQ